MKKRWRQETRPAVLGPVDIRWGPWRTAVEVHQVYCRVSTDATVANRFITLTHSILAPALILSEVGPNGAITASQDAVKCTWGQGYNSLSITIDAANSIRTIFIPFAMILNVGEILTLHLYAAAALDGISDAVCMVRDLDDVERGR